jgi:hypothetical protein
MGRKFRAMVRGVIKPLAKIRGAGDEEPVALVVQAAMDFTGMSVRRVCCVSASTDAIRALNPLWAPLQPLLHNPGTPPVRPC